MYSRLIVPPVNKAFFCSGQGENRENYMGKIHISEAIYLDLLKQNFIMIY